MVWEIAFFCNPRRLADVSTMGWEFSNNPKWRREMKLLLTTVAAVSLIALPAFGQGANSNPASGDTMYQAPGAKKKLQQNDVKGGGESGTSASGTSSNSGDTSGSGSSGSGSASGSGSSSDSGSGAGSGAGSSR